MSVIIIINTMITILICYSNICFNLILLLAIFCSKRVTFKSELSLFYTRFVVDIGYSFSISTFKLYILAIIASNIFDVKNFIFFSMWSNIMFGIIRTSLLFLTSLDRVVALFCPFFYCANRSKLSLVSIYIFIFFLIIFDQIIMFGYCGNTIDTPIDCNNFLCSFNECYITYWVKHEQIVFSIIVALTVLLSVKLVIHTVLAQNQSAQVYSRATQIAMFDSTTLILFNLIPVLSTFWFDSIDYQTFSSFTTLTRNLGFLINTLIIFRIFMRDKNNVVTAVTSPNL